MTADLAKLGLRFEADGIVRVETAINQAFAPGGALEHYRRRLIEASLPKAETAVHRFATGGAFTPQTRQIGE